MSTSRLSLTSCPLPPPPTMGQEEGARWLLRQDRDAPGPALQSSAESSPLPRSQATLEIDLIFQTRKFPPRQLSSQSLQTQQKNSPRVPCQRGFTLPTHGRAQENVHSTQTFLFQVKMKGAHKTLFKTRESNEEFPGICELLCL